MRVLLSEQSHSILQWAPCTGMQLLEWPPSCSSHPAESLVHRQRESFGHIGTEVDKPLCVLLSRVVLKEPLHLTTVLATILGFLQESPPERRNWLLKASLFGISGLQFPTHVEEIQNFCCNLPVSFLLSVAIACKLRVSEFVASG